ncbi:MAG: N-acetyltransferase [Alphaproteobacteria bacterium]|nr:N-acetyltransferase [Alphaproteobacteria bacterium]
MVDGAADLRYRLLAAADAAAFRALRRAALTSDPDQFLMTLPEEDAVPRLFLETVMAQPGEVAGVLGAFVAGDLVGVVGLLASKLRKTVHLARIVSLYVLPAHRRHGIGTELIRRAVVRAFAEPAVQAMRLEVVAANAAALATYRCIGFVAYGTEPEAYRLGDRAWDLVLMTLPRPR